MSPENNMSKIYFSDYKEFLKTKIIDGSKESQVKKYEILLDQFRNEIEWWFSLLTEKSSFAHYIKKPICIELYEYACCLQSTHETLVEIKKIINKYFEDSGRTLPLQMLNKNIKKVLKKTIKKLKEPRNMFAAHRYTKRDGEFITIEKIIHLINKISDTELNKLKEDLFFCHDEIKRWINQNKKYFILSNIKKE